MTNKKGMGTQIPFGNGKRKEDGNAGPFENDKQRGMETQVLSGMANKSKDSKSRFGG